MKEKHPLEWEHEETRIANSPYVRLNENSLMITNFPKGVTVNQKYIKELCLKQDPQAIINRIHFKDALLGYNLGVRNTVAYAIVEFEMPKWVATVRRGLRKHWEIEKLIKVRTLKD